MSEKPYTEKQAIAALQRVTRRWPESLTLFSRSGLLECVDAEHLHRTGEAMRVGPIFDGIDNEGGDPDDGGYRDPRG